MDKAGVSIMNGRCSTHQDRCVNHQRQVCEPSKAGVSITAVLCNSLQEYFDM